MDWNFENGEKIWLEIWKLITNIDMKIGKHSKKKTLENL